MNPITKAPHLADWFFFVALIPVLLYGIMHFGMSGRFRIFLRLPFSKAYFRQYGPDDTQKLNWFTILLESAFYIVTTALLFLLFIRKPVSQVPTDGHIIFLKILLGLLLFIIFQNVFHSLTGYLFRQEKPFSTFLLIKQSFRNYGALLTLPIMILAAYLSGFNAYFLVSAAIVLAGFWAFGLFRGFVFLQKQSNVYGLHIIFYLCALEILPILLLAKAIR